MMSKKSPQLRFEGFTDDWEERKLGDMMDVTSVKRIHQSDWTNSGIRFLRARDIVSAAKNEEPSDYLYISEEKYNEYSKISGKVSQGDLLVTGVGSIGVPLLITDDNPIYFKDGNIIWFKNEHKIDGNFFYYSFINNKIQKYIRDVAGIGTVGTYTIDSGKKTPISLPTYDEQIKIGSFFKQLDDTIALHQHKLDLLKEQKKGFLQKMFPKNGAKVPELRFEGFADDWEQRKLGEMLVNLEAGVSVNSSDYDTGYFILKTSAIKMGNIDLLEVKSIVSEEVARAKTPLIKNSIIISRMNTPELVGASGLVRESIDNIFLPDRLWQGQVAGNFSPEWLIQSINIAANIKKIRDLATGTSGSMKNISKKSMLDLIINVPTLEEQQKIGSFFKQLDNVIALHQLKLDLLKEQKKGFLQKMFA